MMKNKLELFHVIRKAIHSLPHSLNIQIVLTLLGIKIEAIDFNYCNHNNDTQSHVLKIIGVSTKFMFYLESSRESSSLFQKHEKTRLNFSFNSFQ